MIPDIERLRQLFLTSKHASEALPYFEGYFGERASESVPIPVSSNATWQKGLEKLFEGGSPKQIQGQN